MFRVIRVILATALLSSSLLLGGCASSEPTSPTDPAQIGTLPWNRPERGESAGPMGGMLNTR